MRTRVAKEELGMETVPCVELSLTLEQERELNIRLNKNSGAWDFEALSNYFEVDELTDWGFELSDLDMELGEDEPEIEEDDFDGEPPEEPKTELGRIYQLGSHRLMCGDSTSEDDVKRLMGDELADMVFTDPPYGVDYNGINNDSRGGLFDLLSKAFVNYENFSQEGASVYCFHSDKCADIFHEVFRVHCHFSSMMIWVKPALVLSQSDYHSQHEPCLYGWFSNGTHQWHSDRKQTTVWEFGKERVDGHTTPKPVELVAYAICNSSKKDHIVLDLFGGSGSTLIAAEQSKRQCRMMELDPKYCDVIVKRYCKLKDIAPEAVFETGFAK
jgi:DNA modification methylase